MDSIPHFFQLFGRDWWHSVFSLPCQLPVHIPPNSAPSETAFDFLLTRKKQVHGNRGSWTFELGAGLQLAGPSRRGLRG